MEVAVTIKQEVIDEDEQHDIDANLPVDHSDGQISPSKLANLFAEIETKENALFNAWRDLTDALLLYKAEIRRFDKCNWDDSSPPDDKKGLAIYQDWKRVKDENKRVLKELQRCRNELRNKDLQLMSKVCQLGLAEAKLNDANTNIVILQTSLAQAQRKNTTSNPVLDGHSATGIKGQLSPVEQNDKKADDRSLEEPETSGIEIGRSSEAAADVLPTVVDGDAEWTPAVVTTRRRRGRPPGSGRGVRRPATVSMIMRGMTGRKRRRGGRTAGDGTRPKFISQMLAASSPESEGLPLSASRGRGGKSRASNIPIRTLLHMSAIGIDINDQSPSIVNSVNRPGGHETKSTDSNGVGTCDNNDTEENDPFKSLYIDPSEVKLEPVQYDDPEHQTGGHQ